jgi:hypothetical protein
MSPEHTNQVTEWQASNARYLSIALAWLRFKLERRANRDQEALVITPPEAELSRTVSPPDPPLPPKGKRNRQDPAVQAAAVQPKSTPDLAAQMADAEAQSATPVALIMLARRLELSLFERQVLLLCAAMELDTSIASLCAQAQADPARPYPTFALALSLFDDPAWEALSPERPLRYWRLIEISQPAGQPLTSSALRADERIVSYLKGLNYLDDRLAPLLNPLDMTAHMAELPPSQQSVADRIADRLKHGAGNGMLPVIQLLGVEGFSKQLIAVHAARALGLNLYRLPAALIPTQAAELENLARLWQRESMLLPLALYVDGAGSETDSPQPGVTSPLNRFLARTGGVAFLDTRDVMPGLAENTFSAEVAKPTAVEQKEAWTEALGEAAGHTPALLSAQFNLSLADIHEIINRVAGPHDRLWDECLAITRPRLDTLAQRVDAKATWNEIVLPPAETALLHQIAAQVGHRSTVHEGWGFGRRMGRGLGISALFAGDSGTGKTMAAEVIANELRLNLYRIDLSGVVSKYIGETEKNLRRLFDAAEDGGAILFFDEADALFGKRSEIKDSHDRYANIEINYLLQRMEAYGGLAILATNRQSALDSAFMRRLRFVVNFPHPSSAQRKAMWQKAFPKEVPVDELDLERLARLNLTGGNISSIALNTAFQAAQSGVPVSTTLILESTRTELRKLGRVINELEFHGTGRAGRVA